MPYSNISASLTAVQSTAVTGAINTIRTNLNFLINLTKEERSTLSKMGNDGYSYVSKALDYASSNANIIPPAMNYAEALKDLSLYNAMRPLLQQVEQLRESMDDTLMAVGVEAKDFADMFYNLAKNMAKMNVPGMNTVVDDLGEFYERAQQEATNPTPPTP